MGKLAPLVRIDLPRLAVTAPGALQRVLFDADLTEQRIVLDLGDLHRGATERAGLGGRRKPAALKRRQTPLQSINAVRRRAHPLPLIPAVQEGQDVR